jgi:hypothetical protein
MNRFKIFVLCAIVMVCTLAAAPKVQAQISFSVGIAPSCPYGYYDYAPYGCAPYGYYGREWFHGRTFIGAGPWFHGPDHFYGHVDNRFDQQHGYNGRFPNNGERATRRDRSPRHFNGNEVRDGRGHISQENHGEGRH